MTEEKYQERAILLAAMAGAEIKLDESNQYYPWRLYFVDLAGIEWNSTYATRHAAAYVFCDQMKIPIPWGD